MSKVDVRLDEGRGNRWNTSPPTTTTTTQKIERESSNRGIKKMTRTPTGMPLARRDPPITETRRQ